MHITRRPSDTWIIDFGEMTEAKACLYEALFEYVRAHVKPARDKNRRARRQRKRILTNFYNKRPVWFENAHRNLDETVADAYGWKSNMFDEQMLTKLLALNVARAEEGK